jgi:2'-5' RNA ligase
MDHVVIPLAPSHRQSVMRLAAELAAVTGCGRAALPSSPHITLASYRDLELPAAVEALAPVASVTSPFTVRAHAYGMFTGDQPRDLSLHVMVVRTPQLDELHRRIHLALHQAGAHSDGLTEPRVWTPHITLLDRDLTPDRLARAVEVLASRPHCSWSVAVEAITVGPRSGPGRRRLPLRQTRATRSRARSLPG